MRELLLLFVHLIVTVVRLVRPGGLRSVIAESALLRHQLIILNRGRKRAPNLRASDRIIACVWRIHKSCSNRRLVQPSAMLLPPVGRKIYRWSRSPSRRFWQPSLQTRMCAMAIIKMLGEASPPGPPSSRITSGPSIPAEWFQSAALQTDAIEVHTAPF